jgi:hypothetical protein
VAIAYRAIQNGFDARFTTATALIDDLSVATRKGKLRHALPSYTHPHVLIIDEVGYLTYGPDAANVLFHVVNERSLHHRPMIFTTNKPLAAWGRVLHDPDLAQAILDRVLERGRLLELRGPSYRTRHMTLDLQQQPESSSVRPARISGNHRPEFPEPTGPATRSCCNETASTTPSFTPRFFASASAALVLSEMRRASSWAITARIPTVNSLASGRSAVTNLVPKSRGGIVALAG